MTMLFNPVVNADVFDITIFDAVVIIGLELVVLKLYAPEFVIPLGVIRDELIPSLTLTAGIVGTPCAFGKSSLFGSLSPL